MRTLCVCLILLAMAGRVQAVVSVAVYESDGVTPFDNRDISLDTTLTFLIQSDASIPGGYSLALSGENLLRGELAARGPLDGGDWSGSHLADAGSGAGVYTWEEMDVLGFDMYTGATPTPGKWFVIDYHPLAVGAVDVGFYDHSYSLFDPVEIITINTPEPGSLLLISGGILAVLRRRKRRA